MSLLLATTAHLDITTLLQAITRLLRHLGAEKAFHGHRLRGVHPAGLGIMIEYLRRNDKFIVC
jgi:hypothetical protein